MEFKEAMRTWKRMCTTSGGCRKCVFGGKCPCAVTPMEADASECEAIFTKWAAEHPERTIADDFFEKFPNAKKTKDDFPMACAAYCGYIEKCPDDYTLMRCAECWRRPLEEAEEAEEAHHD